MHEVLAGSQSYWGEVYDRIALARRCVADRSIGEVAVNIPRFSARPDESEADYCLRRQSARMLARSIEAAWADCGHHVTCRVAPIRNEDGRILCYSITSDLQNGLPR